MVSPRQRRVYSEERRDGVLDPLLVVCSAALWFLPVPLLATVGSYRFDSAIGVIFAGGLPFLLYSVPFFRALRVRDRDVVNLKMLAFTGGFVAMSLSLATMIAVRVWAGRVGAFPMLAGCVLVSPVVGWSLYRALSGPGRQCVARLALVGVCPVLVAIGSAAAVLLVVRDEDMLPLGLMIALLCAHAGVFTHLTTELLVWGPLPAEPGRASVCEHCGYVLVGLDGAAVCPECGGTSEQAPRVSAVSETA